MPGTQWLLIQRLAKKRMNEEKKNMAPRLWKIRCGFALRGELLPGTGEDADEGTRRLRGQCARDGRGAHGVFESSKSYN